MKFATIALGGGVAALALYLNYQHKLATYNANPSMGSAEEDSAQQLMNFGVPAIGLGLGLLYFMKR